MDTAIIGGTGFDAPDALSIARRERVTTPYGAPSADIALGKIGARAVAFLPRHGARHNLPPQQVNYRANIWALQRLGITRVIALAAVGGIARTLRPGDLVIPHQIIDYTWGRAHTFFDGDSAMARHIDFTNPYSEAARAAILRAADAGRIAVRRAGVYAATQGPRLETAAEIDRLERDGADIVGMTGMPEAALARELDMEYAAIAMVVNPAAGRSKRGIHMEMIAKHLAITGAKAMEIIKRL